jgi:alkylation response protein AidB-like acyl-CoA dehydrogenase
MEYRFTPAEEAFRDEVRSLVAAHFPPSRPYNDSPRHREEWIDALLARGWAAYKWAPDFGGPGWTATQRYIWERETASNGVPAQLGGMGMMMLSPILQGYGSPEQCARHLPGILRNETEWCQGYSEPGAGSDLAALRTRADRDGDVYVVNGEKVWTSWAHIAHWMFCLVRTEETGRRQEGITFLLIDLSSPGIRIRPIPTIDGIYHLNQVVLENVRVPIENRIGDEGQGWTYAKGLLTHERTGLANISLSIFLTRRLRSELARQAEADSPAQPDGSLSVRLSELEMELSALEATELRALSELEAGEVPGPYTSILKLKGSQLVQRATTLFLEAAGLWAQPFALEAQAWNAPALPGPDWAAREVSRYFSGRASSIAGGTDEIQREIITKHVLRLK